MKSTFLKLAKGAAFLFTANIFLIALVILGSLTSFKERKIYGSFDVWTLLQSRFALDLSWFVLALMIVSALLSAIAYLVWRNTALPLIKKENKGYFLVLILFLLQLFLWNSYLFPGSIFSFYSDSLVFVIILAGVSIATLFLLFGGAFTRVRHLMVMLLLIALVFGFFNIELSPLKRRQSSSPPDIVILGIDSLRPDFISPEVMPFLNGFLSDAVVYKKAYTTFGRTYPAWMSILSGVYPIRHGARFNLMPRSKHDPDYRLLPSVLGEAGYESLHASDEKRFSNIDRFHGFDYIAGARIGVSDFILGAVSDIPLINLIRHLSLSRFLFPFIYSNRAASAAYLGHDFIDEIKRGLKSLDPLKPSLIAIHLCEPHWPFTELESNDQTLPWYRPRFQDDFTLQRYSKSLNKVDRQFEHVISELQEAGRLNNALLFIISDHGETFQSDAMTFNPRIKGDSIYGMSSFGHGTSAENFLQYRILMAMKSFKKGRLVTEGRSVGEPVSLIDIYPTILDFLGIDIYNKTDGISLISDRLPSKRDFFAETGFFIPALMKIMPEMEDVLIQALDSYRLDKNGYVVLKDEKLQGLIDDKDLSVFRGDEVLVYKPTPPIGNYRWIWFDYDKKVWQPLDNGENLSDNIISMINSLCSQYAGHTPLDSDALCLKYRKTQN